MAVSETSKIYSAAAGGLMTDGNALSAAGETTLAESNYELLRDATRRRRRPIVEESGALSSMRLSRPQAAATAYLWETPAHRTNIYISAEQVDGDVIFRVHQNDAPTKMHEGVEIVDRLRLRLFGNRFDLENPATFVVTSRCTFAEGDGNLYVFNEDTGTIKAELVRDATNTADRLRFIPVGTWVRDYEGAAEEEPADLRRNTNQTRTEWSAGSPFLSATEPFRITEGLGERRAYNLSNSGWDARGVHDFATQSGSAYFSPDGSRTYLPGASGLVSEAIQRGITQYNQGLPERWPAYTDRYLNGRQIDDRGSSIFSFAQLDQAKDDKSMPPLGSRIGPSDYHPCGTLTGVPSDLSGNAVFTDRVGGAFPLSLGYGSQQYHADGVGNTAIFLHYLSFTVTEGGQVFQGGRSGVYEATTRPGTNGQGLLAQLRICTTSDTAPAVNAAFVHPSPKYFPHILSPRRGGYDYRRRSRPSAGAFYAGRLWQTGDQHSRVYYSQVVDSSLSAAGTSSGVAYESLCHMAADPTNGDDNAIAATDGGYISVSDSGTHYGLVELADVLILLTDRGIWAIAPGGQGYFSADSFRVSKLTSSQVLGDRAWASSGNSLQVATDEGMYTLSRAQGGVQVESILDRRIHTEYLSILRDGDVARLPRGCYEPVSKTYRWVFVREGTLSQSTTSTDIMLSYSMLHEAWYRYDVAGLSGIQDVLTLPYRAKTGSYNRFRYFTTNIYNVLVLTPGQVRTAWAVEAEVGSNGVEAWVDSVGVGRRFVDWRHENPVPAPAFLLTNNLQTDSTRFEQIRYLVVYNRNVTGAWVQEADGSVTENMTGSTLVSAQWDWSDHESFGKFSNPQETYRFRRSYLPAGGTEYTRGEKVLVHKLKIRGRGRAFRLRWEANGQHDSHIEGWAINGYTLNGV